MSEEKTEGIVTTDEELTALMAQNSKLQEKENADEGVKADYLLLAKQGTKALSRANKDLYIEGLSMGDIFLQKSKTNLGASVQVVPLSFLTIYQEKESSAQDAKFFGVWNKEQAGQFPLVDGSYYNRKLPNGHVLVPVNWVMVEVIGHDEIKNGVVAFKSTGSRIWKAWKTDVKNRSTASATLCYDLHEEPHHNDKFTWTDFGFSYIGSLLEMHFPRKDEEGNDIMVDGKVEAVKCLKKSNKLRTDYDNAVLIANHDIASLNDVTRETALLADASETADSFDDEEAGF